MIFCLVIDNGLKTSKSTQSSSSFTLLDMYKTIVEAFCKLKLTSPPSTENKFILFTTSSCHQCRMKTNYECSSDQVIEQVKTIKSEGFSDWDETFRQMSEYLGILRIATGVDTLGQGIFMSTVRNVCIVVFSQQIPKFLGEFWRREKLLKTSSSLQSANHPIPEPLLSFVGNSFDRSDLGMHLFIPFLKDSSLVSSHIEAFKGHLGIGNSRFHVHSFVDQKSCLEILVQLPASTSFLTVNFLPFSTTSEKVLEQSQNHHSNLHFSKATIIPTDLRHGYWCFPEPNSYQSKLEMHPKQLFPRPPFVCLWLRRSKSNLPARIPPKFPVDEYVIYPDSMEEFLQMLNVEKAELQNELTIFDVYSSDSESVVAKPFGQMKIQRSSSQTSPNSISLTLMPWNFEELFAILASLPTSTSIAFGDRLYRFIGEEVPKNYIDTLKRALKFMGISTKFPKSLNEGYIPECLRARNLLSQTASSYLQVLHECIRSEMQDCFNWNAALNASKIQIPTQESLKSTRIPNLFTGKTFLQISKLFFQTTSQAKVQNHDEQNVLLPVSKMGDFHRNLAEFLKFRNPYQDDDEQSIANSNLFQSPFKRRKSLSSQSASSDGSSNEENVKSSQSNKRARIDLVGADVGEDDEFSNVLLEVSSSPSSYVESAKFSQNSSVLAEPLQPELHLPIASMEDLLKAVRNPGDSIAKFAFLILEKTITPPMKETLCQEALRWKKYRLVDFINKLQMERLTFH